MTDSPQENSLAVATVTVGGMHCPACAARVVKALKGIAGVQEAEVVLESRQAHVRYRPGTVTPAMVQQAITDAGYTCEGADFS